MNRRSRAAAAGAAGAALLACAALPGTAQAHGLVGREDLPLPGWLFGWAAAVVLIVSFAALSSGWRETRLEHPRERPLVRIPVAVDVLCGAIGVAVFALVIWSGLAGVRNATTNLAPTFVYVHFWVGLAVLSVLLGDVFRAFNPWLAIARAASWVTGRLGGGPGSEPLPYPAWLGRWPAAVGILAFAWLELASPSRDDPHLLALLAIGYAIVQLVGMALFGIETWSRRGDAFGVLWGLYARLSPLARRGGTLVMRPPLAGAAALDPVPGTVALLCAAIGTTAFDGASTTGLWTSVAPTLQRWFTGLGLGLEGALELAMTVGIIVAVVVVAAIYRIGVAGMRRVEGGGDPRALAGRFAHSLIPIAFAYALAHYLSLLLFQGQAIGYLASDPLGRGWDLFGTASAGIDYGVMSAKGIWYLQVAALVGGHVAGLVLAHDRAIAVYRRAREATRSQGWMLLVMVGFTSLGLWLLSAMNA